jgi:hypothetical protein
MRILPSIPAAILCGAFVTPLAIAVVSLIELRFHVRLPSILRVFVVVIPLVLSTIDLRPMRDWRFGIQWVAKAHFRTIIPQSKRAGLYFVSLLTSLLVLDHIGLKF